MAKRLRIRIKLDQLRENLSREEGRALGDGDVRQWLVDAGFQPQGDETWTVREGDLGQLDPSEVTEVADETV